MSVVDDVRKTRREASLPDDDARVLFELRRSLGHEREILAQRFERGQEVVQPRCVRCVLGEPFDACDDSGLERRSQLDGRQVLRPRSRGALCRCALADASSCPFASLSDAVPASDGTVTAADRLGVRPCLRELPGRSLDVLLDQGLQTKTAAKQLASAVGDAGKPASRGKLLDLPPLGIARGDAARPSGRSAWLRFSFPRACACALARWHCRPLLLGFHNPF